MPEDCNSQSLQRLFADLEAKSATLGLSRLELLNELVRLEHLNSLKLFSVICQDLMDLDIMTQAWS